LDTETWPTGEGARLMCRYAMHPVKTHFACLDCRHTAKHPQAPLYGPGPHCPHCRVEMVDLGRDFRAPRKAATAQWEKVRRLVTAGLRFDSCGCSGPGYRPRTLSDVKSQLRQRRTDRKVWV
jgi:hypothetical protein